MEPWYKIATPRKEVREGRSFNPDEFAIHLEQVVAKTAPEDYRDPKLFFSRTCFTRALREHAGMVLRRLAGETANTAPVMTLVTQFGGGKTHTLATLFHLVSDSKSAGEFQGVTGLLSETGVSSIPDTHVAVFVGNAWDPKDGRETPWIDIARQLAGDKAVHELGTAAKSTPPGTEALNRIFQAANAPVLILFDEVLNFMNRHRGMADQFYSFLQNLTVAATGTDRCAVMISLPRSQVEMTESDMKWQDKITKVVRRVAKDLIATDEAEVAEVICRRLFDNIGSERIRKNISKVYADWCFERRAQLPAEWTAVDSAATEAKARDFLRGRFEACYPFHPATLSVFQRKWAALSQYQQTRGTLAMFAQWIAWAYKTGFAEARRESLITLGSAPLNVPEFRSVVLGQLGESRLVAAIDSDISSELSHARALDADTKGPLRNIHQRVGAAILFESSGGQVDKVAHLPELRFALGEPEIDTTSVDTAAFTLEDKSYFIRRVGSDGFKISHQPTLKKVVNDRRASLDEETEIKPTSRKLIDEEFKRGTGIPLVMFPEDGTAIQDTPKLTLVIIDPLTEWTEDGSFSNTLREWTKSRGKSPRLYPASLVWCMKKPGRDLRDSVEMLLAWKKVEFEISDGSLGGEFDKTERSRIRAKLIEAEESVKDEIWGSYRFAILEDRSELGGLRVIDLGAGHSSSGETFAGRVISALKSQGLLNDSVGAGFIERNWPPALKSSGTWPLRSLRQSFLDGSLTRLIDPDTTLRAKVVDWISRGDFGLASNEISAGKYERIWFNEPITRDEVLFESGVFLLLKSFAQEFRQPVLPTEEPTPAETTQLPTPVQVPVTEPGEEVSGTAKAQVIRISGDVPPELWNRLGRMILPKLRSGEELKVGIDFRVTVANQLALQLGDEIKQMLDDLGLTGKVRVE